MKVSHFFHWLRSSSFFLFMKDNFFLIFFIFVFILKILESFLPFEHGDALYYHLVGPKIWYQYSWDEMWKDLVLFIQAGIFDFFYILPFFFFKSLLKIQMAGQFMHFLFSIGLASIIAYKKLCHKIWGPLAGLIFLTISRDASFFLYAKNDGVVALVCLVAAIYIFEKKYTTKNLFLIGVFLGLAPSVKMNGLMTVLPLTLFFIFFNLYPKRNFKNILWVGLIALLVFLPTLWKNYYYIGNALFPAMVHRFPGKLSEPMFQHFTHYYDNAHALTPSLLFGQLQDFILGKVIFLLFPILFVINWKNRQFNINHYATTAFLTFVLYVMFNGGLRHPRYFFSCYFLLAYFMSLSFYSLWQRWGVLQTSVMIRKAFLFVVFALICIDSKIDKSLSHTKEMFTLHANLSEHEIIRRRIPLTALVDKVKVKHFGKITYVLSDYLSDSYYLPDGVRLHTSMQTPQAAFLVKCDQPGDVKKLEYYSYALLLEKKENDCYRYIRNRGTLLSTVAGFEMFALEHPTSP